MATPGVESVGSPQEQKRPKRILACILCQQRKVKCDRKFPCSSCIKSRAECVQATLPTRPRKRRFPERILLERIRKYEDLLRQNNISFDGEAKDLSESENEESPKAGRNNEAKNIWHVMSKGYRDVDHENDSSEDDLREATIKKVWEQSIDRDYNDHLLFGSHDFDISNVHPEPVQIFKLWQIYLDNVNPLLKVTHTPTLQSRIIEAASNVKKISPSLEALMFSIYCTAILSLTESDCQTMFSTSHEDLLNKYQHGCRQALSNAKFLRTTDRECLTALFLYLISTRYRTAPQSLSSLLSLAIRISQRMGLNSEHNLAKYSPDEAELRRRLWWSLVLFETRTCETANTRIVSLDPTWDCKVPLNLNESDIRPEMKATALSIPTDALFIVIRSEIGDFIRQTTFHLDFTNPALKPISKMRGDPAQQGEELAKLEDNIENKYFKFCNPENPLHFMTMWMTRAYIAKCRLFEHYSRYLSSPELRTETQRDIVTSHALRMLTCDTKIMSSPLCKGFFWMNQMYFPFPAYIQLAQDLKRRPESSLARQSWIVMNENYDAWFRYHFANDSPFFQIFAKLILQAWDAYEATLKQQGENPTTPQIVSSIRQTQADVTQLEQLANVDISEMAMEMDEYLLPMPQVELQAATYDPTLQHPFAATNPGMFTPDPAQFQFHPMMNRMWRHPAWS